MSCLIVMPDILIFEFTWDGVYRAHRLYLMLFSKDRICKFMHFSFGELRRADVLNNMESPIMTLFRFFRSTPVLRVGSLKLLQLILALWRLEVDCIILTSTRRLHRRSLRLPTRRKWAQSGYLCTIRRLRLRHGQMQGFLGLKVGGGCLNLQIWDLNRAHKTERTVFPILQVFSMSKRKLWHKRKHKGYSTNSAMNTLWTQNTFTFNKTNKAIGDWLISSCLLLS